MTLDTILNQLVYNNADRLIAKIDCEGCEYSLLITDCKTLNIFSQVLIEIHGAAYPLIDKMQSCGFKTKQIAVLIPGETLPISLWLFERIS